MSFITSSELSSRLNIFLSRGEKFAERSHKIIWVSSILRTFSSVTTIKLLRLVPKN